MTSDERKQYCRNRAKQFYYSVEGKALRQTEKNVVRGLLCQACNHTIGLMQENPEALRRAAEYLEKKN